MAIDIKSLRIGSHVEYDGKRVCVDEIRTLRPDGEPMRLIASYNGLVYGNPSIDEVEPIAITPELLKELGLKYRTPICIWIKASEDEYLSFERICGTNRWRIHIYIGNEDRGKCVCRYLHEAEAFLALHGIELIQN